jgi:dolichol-phosphate mannosyltransferase
MSLELSVIIPTFNERDNVLPLMKRLDDALLGIDWEVMFVDDGSQDGTAIYIRQLSQTNPRVRCIERIRRRGVSSACREGMSESRAAYLAVMDCDLQHDETILPKMLQTLRGQPIEIVIGSRYVEGGSIGEWSKVRHLLSVLATAFCKPLIRSNVNDPLSGFFMLKRSLFELVAPRLTDRGFKLLFDILASSQRPVPYQEIPFHFRPRNAGQSKFGAIFVKEYFFLLTEKSIGRWVPVHLFIVGMALMFCLIAHLLMLILGFKVVNLPFYAAQGSAVAAVIALTFITKNIFTYQDLRLRGRAFFNGLARFAASCFSGALINVALAVFLYNHGITWWLSGLLGSAAGTVGNYAAKAWTTKGVLSL